QFNALLKAGEDVTVMMRSDVTLDHFDNLQARMIAGGDWWDMRTPRRTGPALLKTALAGLLQIEFGLVEHMDRSLLMLSAAMGWPYRPLRARMNEGTEAPVSPRFEE